jgi:hypothetical protein
MPVMMVAGLYNFNTSLGKLMASQQVLLQYQEYVSLASVSLNVLPIGITSNQNKTNQAAN